MTDIALHERKTKTETIRIIEDDRIQAHYTRETRQQLWICYGLVVDLLQKDLLTSVKIIIIINKFV